MCEEEKDKVTKNQSFLCAVFGGLSLPNTHIFPDNKRYEEVDGVRKEKERLTTDQSTSTSYLSLRHWARYDVVGGRLTFQLFLSHH